MEAEQPESMHINVSGLSTLRHHFSVCSGGCMMTALAPCVVGCREDFTRTRFVDFLDDVVLLLLLAVESVGDGDLLLEPLSDRLRLRCRVFFTVRRFGVFFMPSFFNSRSDLAAFINASFLRSSDPPPLSKHCCFVCPIRPQFSHFGISRI